MSDHKNYDPLPSTEEDAFDLPIRPPSVSPLRRFIYCASVFLCSLSLVGFGFFLGTRGWAVSKTSWIAPAGDQHYYMHFNDSFPHKSAPETDAAWDALFPEKLGFVQHPELAPNVAGLAIFHELHCLNILRTAFFASVDGTLNETSAEDLDRNHRTSPHHMRHCFEYLRQSLICLADTNLEAMNYTTRGVSGWQTERTCRNFDEVKSWANEWGISREEALDNFDRQVDSGNSP